MLGKSRKKSCLWNNWNSVLTGFGIKTHNECMRNWDSCWLLPNHSALGRIFFLILISSITWGILVRIPLHTLEWCCSVNGEMKDKEVALGVVMCEWERGCTRNCWVYFRVDWHGTLPSVACFLIICNLTLLLLIKTSLLILCI